MAHGRLGSVRRIAALQVGFALLLSFYMAPYQHVHLRSDHEHGSGRHSFQTILHTHFFGGSLNSGIIHKGHQFDGVDDDHSTARSLDTFTLIVEHGPAAILPSRSPIPLYVPLKSIHGVEIVEERGHEPPSIDFSAPRAPPV